MPFIERRHPLETNYTFLKQVPFPIFIFHSFFLYLAIEKISFCTIPKVLFNTLKVIFYSVEEIMDAVKVLGYAPKTLGHAPEVINSTKKVMGHAPELIMSAPKLLRNAIAVSTCFKININKTL